MTHIDMLSIVGSDSAASEDAQLSKVPVQILEPLETLHVDLCSRRHCSACFPQPRQFELQKKEKRKLTV